MSKSIFLKFWAIFLVLAMAMPSTLFTAEENAELQKSATDAGVVDTQIQKEISLSAKQPTLPKPDIEHSEKEEPADASASSIRFFVNAFVFDGNRRIATERLKEIAAPFENQEQTMKAVRELTLLITSEYRTRGYITSQAYIPVQKIKKKGDFRIAIIEGKFGNLVVEGNKYSRKKLILSYSTLTPGEVFRYEDLGRTISRMNRNPDRTVKAVLSKSAKADSSDVYLKVEDRFPLHGGYSMDNQGSNTTGKVRFGFNARDSNLFGMDDALSVGTIFSRSMGSLFSQYVFPIPNWETKLSFGFSHTQLSPQKELKPLGVNSLSQSFTPKVEKRFYEGPRLTLDFSSQFDFKESRTRILSTPFRRDRLRVLRLGPSMTLNDSWGATQMSHTASVGFDGLGASIYTSTPSTSRDIKPGFWRYQGDFSRYQRMPLNTKLIMKGQLQLANQPLPSSEALYLGGASSVRGYPEGDFLSDRGFILNLDYLIPFFFVPKEWHLPWSKKPIREQMEFIVFLDEAYGVVSKPTATQVPRRNLLGMGGGVRVHLYDHVFLRAEFGEAVGQTSVSRDDKRFQAMLKLQTEI